MSEQITSKKKHSVIERPKLFTVKKFAQKNREQGTWPDSEASIWALRKGSPKNGCEEVFVFIGGRVLIDEEKFWEAVENSSGNTERRKRKKENKIPIHSLTKRQKRRLESKNPLLITLTNEEKKLFKEIHINRKSGKRKVNKSELVIEAIKLLSKNERANLERK